MKLENQESTKEGKQENVDNNAAPCPRSLTEIGLKFGKIIRATKSHSWVMKGSYYMIGEQKGTMFDLMQKNADGNFESTGLWHFAGKEALDIVMWEEIV
jgi:hypothetical protein